MIKWDSSRDARMIQYSQINKHNTSHKQNERQKSHDHIIDAEKAFDKVRHRFMKKALSQVGVEGAYLNIIKAMYHSANIILKLSH